MESAADLIGALVELTTCMEHSHNDFKSRLVQLLMLVNRYASSVVFYCYGVVFIDSHFDIGAIACHSLVDRVVDGLVYKMMESFLADVTNIHCRALAYCLEAFKHLNITG